MFVKRWLIAACIFVLALVVSASVTDKILQIPLLEVGGLWVKASEALTSRLITALTTAPDMTSPWTYVKLVAVTGLLYGLYAVFYRPLNRIKRLGDIGYIPEGGLSTKDTANFVQKRRKMGNIPPPYPNGWFGVMESEELKAGEAKPASVLGLNLAVFRDENGQAHILDAYCPHMGAHLAAGGRVQGDCLECPFHAWKFRGEDGKCVSIPYSEKIPNIAKVKSWPVKEISGWICLWFHAEDVDPTWEIPVIEELQNKTWVYRGRTEHYINAHIEEIPENGADVVHLNQVHGPIFMAGVDLRSMWNKWWSFAQHLWQASWEPLPEPDAHVSRLKLMHKVSIFGLHVPILDLNVQARQIGPALVYMEFESVFGRGVFVQTVTPQEPLIQRVVHTFYANAWMPPFIAKFYLIGEAWQVERDIMIWNNKRYEGKPIYIKSKEDSLMAKHRRWYSQFYSENSPRFFQKEGLDF